MRSLRLRHPPEERDDRIEEITDLRQLLAHV
jgi:hypothetical protein